MPIERFYLKSDLSRGATLFLTGAEHHHLARVMRLSDGEEVELVNGQGSLAKARIGKIEKEKTTLQILQEEREAPPTFPLILAVALMRPSKLEWVIEKGTELGADAFCLYTADHSDKTTLSEHQMERFRHLSIAALKQSGRLYLPPIERIPHLNEIFRREALFLFGDLSEQATPLSRLTLKESPTVFITGPEQGFSVGEKGLLAQKGEGVKINRHTLRAETAPIAALSMLNIVLDRI